ncbi:hypothetical protein OSB04_024434, partial [Centaurea solstitialis]
MIDTTMINGLPSSASWQDLKKGNKGIIVFLLSEIFGEYSVSITRLKVYTSFLSFETQIFPQFHNDFVKFLFGYEIEYDFKGDVSQYNFSGHPRRILKENMILVLILSSNPS